MRDAASLDQAAAGVPPSGWIYAPDVESAVSEEECGFLAGLAVGLDVLELGAYYGRSTIAMGSTARWVHTVDPLWAGPANDWKAKTIAGDLIQNLRRYGVDGNVTVHVGYSMQVLPLFRPQSFDLVFVDAMHDRDSVQKDIDLALPLVRPGGTLAFHDYGVEGVDYEGIHWDFDVRTPVDALAGRLGVPVRVVGTVASLQLPG